MKGIIHDAFTNFKDKNNYDIRDMVIHLPELEHELTSKITIELNKIMIQHKHCSCNADKEILGLLIGGSD